MDALQVAYRLVQAVVHLKEKFNLSHCDIRPSNVVATKLTSNSSLDGFKLSEFYVARKTDESFQGVHNGDIEWLAPELYVRSLVQ